MASARVPQVRHSSYFEHLLIPGLRDRAARSRQLLQIDGLKQKSKVHIMDIMVAYESDIWGDMQYYARPHGPTFFIQHITYLQRKTFSIIIPQKPYLFPRSVLAARVLLWWCTSCLFSVPWLVDRLKIRNRWILQVKSPWKGGQHFIETEIALPFLDP
jgi:hypothetical protein